jgi:hypothetical protein
MVDHGVDRGVPGSFPVKVESKGCFDGVGTGFCGRVNSCEGIHKFDRGSWCFVFETGTSGFWELVPDSGTVFSGETVWEGSGHSRELTGSRHGLFDKLRGTLRGFVRVEGVWDEDSSHVFPVRECGFECLGAGVGVSFGVFEEFDFFFEFLRVIDGGEDGEYLSDLFS